MFGISYKKIWKKLFVIMNFVFDLIVPDSKPNEDEPFL